MIKEVISEEDAEGITLTADLGMFVYGYSMDVLITIQAYIATTLFHWDPQQAVYYGGFMNSNYAVGSALGGIGGRSSREIYRKKKCHASS